MDLCAGHGCRVQPFPQDFINTLLFKYGENGDRTVDKSHMLKDWSLVDRLHLVDVAVLVVNAQYDIVRIGEPFVKETLPAAKWLNFETSSHKPSWEEREKYMQAVGEFLE